jgi:hypothetical protein
MSNTYLKKYNYQTIDELKKAIQEYNKNNPDDMITNSRRYKTWARENKAPSSPKDSYGIDGLLFKDLLETKKSLTETVDFFIKNDITSPYKLRVSDRSKWPVNVYMTPNALLKAGFSWSMVTGIKKEKIDWMLMSDAIEYYKALRDKYNLSNISRQYREYSSEAPINLPKDPVSVYGRDGFSWSLVTNNTNGVIQARASRLEIARLINTQADMIDTLDDTLVAIILSKLYDNPKLTDFVKSKVKSMISKVIEENKKGERKEALIEVSKIIEEASNFDEMSVESIPDVIQNDDLTYDVSEVEVEDVNSEETVMTVNYEEKLKSIVRVTNENILNEDLNVDVRELMIKNAIKSLWYLECSK